MGIGINAGPMVMGAMGSKDRMDYTVLGDNVNLGAMLCSAAKAGEIIISKRVVCFLSKSHSMKLRPLDPLKVKEKKDVIEVFAVTKDVGTSIQVYNITHKQANKVQSFLIILLVLEY